jgi:16S rRNA (guanine966-N2)-methyltransferase
MRIIAGSARGRRILTPPDRSTRPALDRTRESLFAILGDIVEGARVLDLFAGSGALGLEALSRGAREVHFVEHSKPAAALIGENARNLGFMGRSTITRGDALRRPDLEQIAPETYDLVFVDPPFALFASPSGAEKVFTRLRELLGAKSLAESAVVVLRLPSSWRGEPPLEPFDSRKYRQSRILLYHRPAARAETTSDPGI